MPAFTSLKFIPWLPLVILGASLGYALSILTRLPWWSSFIVTFLWVGVSVKLRWGHASDSRYRRVWPWSLAPLILWGIYVYLAASFGNVDLAAIFFHLQAGIAEHGGIGRMVAAVLHTAAMLALLASFIWLVRHDSRWRLLERFLAVVLLVANPLLYGLGQRSAVIVTDDGAWLDRRYVPPQLEKQPSPPNLLLIYLESLERTYTNQEHFGDTYADLAALGEQGVVFEGIQQVENTGWTMAGMIASQCGVPLMPAGLLHDRQFEPLARVVPGVSCLGDLLAEQGYEMSFLGGASTQFAGKGLFYSGHGFSNVLGREALEPRLEDATYLNSWGLYDDSLYDFTLEEIRRLDTMDGPWGVVNLSITSHAPHGYPAQACVDPLGEFDGVDILYSVKCSAWLATDLIERLRQEGLLENTVVVVASDHLTMRVPVWDQLVSLDRDNTLIMFGDSLEPRRIQRNATTMDVFPTILEALGYSLEEGRAGIGVSLLQDSTQTLLEKHGPETLAEKLHAERALQERLWEGLEPQQLANEGEATVPQQVLETLADRADEISISR
ncbi:sulfatase-like hydrolase/transferase [Halomonas sp. Bachu 37]|uniref:sulfatase-like hydrolase/transferase n=1 Tax=Halomonas kashgarensis TaxID=3084920 RepID=UPI00321749CC